MSFRHSKLRGVIQYQLGGPVTILLSPWRIQVHVFCGDYFDEQLNAASGSSLFRRTVKLRRKREEFSEEAIG